MSQPIYSLKQLADFLNVELHGNGATLISGVEEIGEAKAAHITFLYNEKYAKHLKSSEAGAIILSRSQFQKYRELNKNFLVVSESPSLAFQKCL